MMIKNSKLNADHLKWYKLALLLAVITVFYNIAEGIFCTVMGYKDETISLFGFGMDSFVEVLSGVAIWRMICKMQRGSQGEKEATEEVTLKIISIAFYLLAVGLFFTAGFSLIEKHKPETTFWGMVVSVISILTMWALIYGKKKAGHALNSQAIIADANCTKACMLLSVVLFLSSFIYEFTGIGAVDAIGAILIALYAIKEGRETMKKSKGIDCCSTCQ